MSPYNFFKNWFDSHLANWFDSHLASHFSNDLSTNMPQKSCLCEPIPHFSAAALSQTLETIVNKVTADLWIARFDDWLPSPWPISHTCQWIILSLEETFFQLTCKTLLSPTVPAQFSVFFSTSSSSTNSEYWKPAGFRPQNAFVL